MTRQEYEKNYLEINGMIITPKCTKNILQQEIIDEETGEIKIMDVEDYTITKTAQQVYDEWMERLNNPLPTPISLEERITQLEVLQVNSMSVQIENQILGGQI